VVTAQLVPRRQVEEAPAANAEPAGVTVPLPQSPRNTMSGIERTFENESAQPDLADVPDEVAAEAIEVTTRADSKPHCKTTMPRLAGSYKLPSTALLHRADEHSDINEIELKKPGAGAGGKMRRVRCAWPGGAN